MRVFLSFSSSRSEDAKGLALRLIGDRHRVFYDRLSLPEGEAYDSRIRHEIDRADLMIFLVDEDFLRPKAYTLTELALAERRWRHPEGHTLPVLIDDLDAKKLPPWLGAVTALRIGGNMSADVAAAVEVIVRRQRRRRRPRLAVATAAAVAVAGGFSAVATRTTRPRPAPTHVAEASGDPDFGAARSPRDGGIDTSSAGRPIAAEPLGPQPRPRPPPSSGRNGHQQMAAPIQSAKPVVLEVVYDGREPCEVGRCLLLRLPVKPLPDGGYLTMKGRPGFRCVLGKPLPNGKHVPCNVVDPDQAVESLVGQKLVWTPVLEAK